MADNVTLPGTGAVVATEEVAGAQVQIVKLAANSGVDIGNVDITSMPAVTITSTPEVTTQSAQSWYPDPLMGLNYQDAGDAKPLKSDPYGFLYTRSVVITDEGGKQTDFPTDIVSTLYGTFTFTNGSYTVTGVGSTFTDGTIKRGTYIKLEVDNDEDYALVIDMPDDTHLILDALYTGTGGTGNMNYSMFWQSVGAGGSISIANSICTISSGTTPGSGTFLGLQVDWLPLTVIHRGLYVSQRAPGQRIVFGLFDNLDKSLAQNAAFIQLDEGNVNSCRLITHTGLQTADRNVVDFSLPTGSIVAIPTNSLDHGRWIIEVHDDVVVVLYNDIKVAESRLHVPQNYTNLYWLAGIINSAEGTIENTNIYLDELLIKNYDELAISSQGIGKPVTANIQDSHGCEIDSQKGSLNVNITNTDFIPVNLPQLDTGRAMIQALGSEGQALSQKPNTFEQFTHDTNLSTVLGSESLLANVSGDKRLKVESTFTDTPAKFDSLNALNDTLTYEVAGRGIVSIQLSGTWAGTVSFEATLDRTNWLAVAGLGLTAATPAISTTAGGIFRFNCTGVQQIRIRMSLYTSGSAAITVVASTNTTNQFLMQDTSYRLVTADANAATLVTDFGSASLISPINRVIPPAPIAFATQTTYTAQTFFGTPLIQPRLRVEAAGSQQLPMAQKESTYELKTLDEPVRRMLEDQFLQSMILNQQTLVNNDSSRQGSNIGQISGMSGYIFTELR